MSPTIALEISARTLWGRSPRPLSTSFNQSGRVRRSASSCTVFLSPAIVKVYARAARWGLIWVGAPAFGYLRDRDASRLGSRAAPSARTARDWLAGGVSVFLSALRRLTVRRVGTLGRA